MSILPKPMDVVTLIREVTKQLAIDALTGIGFICIVVYILSAISMCCDKDIVNGKGIKVAIGSILAYFLSKAVMFLFI